LPSREDREYELNEVGWWSKWVDETVWVSKNGYAVFSDEFKGEDFYNRGGFLAAERVPEDAVEAIEREFAKRKRSKPCIVVEEGRPWEKVRASLSKRGYAVADTMLVMEGRGKAKTPPKPEVITMARGEATLALLHSSDKWNGAS